MNLHAKLQNVCRGWVDYMKDKDGVEVYGVDCSCGCKYFLDGVGGIGDWGVCLNPESPRAGLLTWEHQGCKNYKE